MNNIDQVYYVATTTQMSPDYAITGYEVTVSSYTLPFLDFLLVFLVLVFSIIAILVTDYFCYSKDTVIKLKNSIRVLKK